MLKWLVVWLWSRVVNRCTNVCREKRFRRKYEGKLYEMQDRKNLKFNLYKVKYDAIKDRDNNVWADD